MILERLTDAIGSTPQVRLRSLEQETPGVDTGIAYGWIGAALGVQVALVIKADRCLLAAPGEPACPASRRTERT